MRKIVLALAAVSSIASAQTAQRMPPGVNTAGYPVTLPDGSKVLVQATTAVDANGNPVAGGGGSSSAVAQGSTTSGQTGTLVQCAVVTGNQTYTIGTTQPCNLTPSGRLKVGLSSTTNLAPAATPATTLESVLTGCIYRAAGATYTDQFSGAVACDASGRLLTTGNDTVTNGGTFAVQNTAATPAGTNTIGNVLRALYYNETATPLAANGTFIGPGRDSGAPGTASPWNMFSCFFRTDQAGPANGANIQGSTDNATWITELSATMAANVSVTLTGRTYFRYHRCVLFNSGNAQTVLNVNSQLGE